MKRQRLAVVISIVGFSVLLGGCAGAPSPKPVDTVAVSPVVTIKGIVKVAGTSIFVNNNGVSTEITSRKLDLKSYDGKEVSVTGEFSGTTLYVDEVI